MIWVKFPSLESFNAWHEEIKEHLGLPKISTDSDGNLIPEATITTDYVLPVVLSSDDVRALIDEEYAEGLELSEVPFESNYGSTVA